MAKGKKPKTAEKQARTLAKQSKKAGKSEKKAKTKAASRENDDSDAEAGVDLDAILASFAQEQAKFLKVTEEASDPPSPRSSSTIIASPSNRNELLVFGGEYYDGATARFYNDLFVYLIDRGEWRQVSSPNSPLPRSGHAWCRGGNAGGIYLFGGEFSSPKQGTFHHYNDFWSLDPASREWTRIESKKQGPSARSGHRMVYYKNLIILFGGFQDTSQSTKYLQDLWVYNCQEYVWHEIKFATGAGKPDPRSSLSFLPHESGAVLYGGYSRVKAMVAAGKQGKSKGPARNILKPMIHQDTWFLNITIPESQSQSSSIPSVQWRQRKKPANQPNPTRAGATMAYHKGRGILFGGVHDVEESEEGIDSEFFQQLFAWNCDRNRFFPLSLRRPKAQSKKQQPSAAVRGRQRGKADEEELLRNLAALDAGGSLADRDNDTMEIDQPGPSEAPTKREMVTRFEFPHGRFNAQLTVQDDTLFIFGGTFERGDREFTFNDMYSLDLAKLNGVQEVFYREPENWADLLEQDMDSEDDEDEDSDDDDDDMSIDAATDVASVSTTVVDYIVDEIAPIVEVEKETSAKDDPRPFPRPFESLRDFFTRTSNEWQSLVLADMMKGGSDIVRAPSEKELRTKAFFQADERWWDCREEIRALEDEQEEAGIGEVISIADRGGDADPGIGRRR